jgi:hypothetical protein
VPGVHVQEKKSILQAGRFNLPNYQITHLPNSIRSLVRNVKIILDPPHCAPLAQLDRASDYESEGREFESLRARHFSDFTL